MSAKIFQQKKVCDTNIQRTIERHWMDEIERLKINYLNGYKNIDLISYYVVAFLLKSRQQQSLACFSRQFIAFPCGAFNDE